MKANFFVCLQDTVQTIVPEIVPKKFEASEKSKPGASCLERDLGRVHLTNLNWDFNLRKKI